jgi:hypothetical protein
MRAKAGGRCAFLLVAHSGGAGGQPAGPLSAVLPSVIGVLRDQAAVKPSRAFPALEPINRLSAIREPQEAATPFAPFLDEMHWLRGALSACSIDRSNIAPRSALCQHVQPELRGAARSGRADSPRLAGDGGRRGSNRALHRRTSIPLTEPPALNSIAGSLSRGVLYRVWPARSRDAVEALTLPESNEQRPCCRKVGPRPLTRNRRAGVYELSGRASTQAAFDQPHRAPERRNQASRRGRQHPPERRRDHPPRRCPPPRAEQ